MRKAWSHSDGAELAPETSAEPKPELRAFSSAQLAAELVARTREAAHPSDDESPTPTADARVQCPVCGWTGSAFHDYDCGHSNIYRNAACPSCGSHPRHRAQYLYLNEVLPRDRPIRVLHFAPETSIERFFRSCVNVGYLSVDIDEQYAMRVEDITNLSFADGSMDVIFCSHVLEHIEDDRQAMSELRRVLSPDGFAILDVPIDWNREETYEDPSVVSPEDRAREFWQFDHVRLYGKDFPAKLRTAGFQVAESDFISARGEEERQRLGLEPLPIYHCTK